jgi:hypothetical protein
MLIVFSSSVRAYCKSVKLLVYLDVSVIIDHRQKILQNDNEVLFMYTKYMPLYGDFYHKNCYYI